MRSGPGGRLLKDHYFFFCLSFCELFCKCAVEPWSAEVGSFVSVYFLIGCGGSLLVDWVAYKRRSPSMINNLLCSGIYSHYQRDEHHRALV